MELWRVRGNEMTDITPIVGTVTWGSSIEELGMELSFDIAYNDTRYFPKNPCDIGDVVILKNRL